MIRLFTLPAIGRTRNSAATGLAALLFISTFGTQHADEISAEAILNLLLKKGLVTQEEILQLQEETVASTPDASSTVSDTKSANASENALPAAKTKDDEEQVKFYWKNGLQFKGGKSTKVKGKIGGRLMIDSTIFDADDAIESLPGVGDLEPQTEFRRARLFTEGQYQASSVPVGYKFEVDFAGAAVRITDAYVELGDLPGVGDMKIGHFREPFGLEELTSSKYITLIERSSASEAFSPARNTGIMVGNSILEDRMTWNTGIFVGADDSSGNSLFDSNYRISGRLTGLPYLNDEKSELIHLGISLGFEDPENDTVRYGSTPESHVAPRLVDTGNLSADSTVLSSIEAAYVRGPFSLQGEYMMNYVERNAVKDPLLTGYYVFGSWFVTGESRVYSKSKGAFDRVIPHKNFALGGEGIGAWELAIRYSSIDLNEDGVAGGKMNGTTAGINWYLNPNARFMLNYVFSEVERAGANGDLHAVETRVSVDF